MIEALSRVFDSSATPSPCEVPLDPMERAARGQGRAWPTLMSTTPPARGATPAALALVLHPTYSGYAALDGFGARAFGTSRLPRNVSDRTSMLVRLIESLVRRVRPARIVLGIPPRDEPKALILRRLVSRLCSKLRVEVVVRPLACALERLGFSRRSTERNGLANHLVRNFLPELFTQLRRGLDRFWYRRPAWHAAALALSELVEIAPFSAAALVPASGHSVAPFRVALQAATARV